MASLFASAADRRDGVGRLGRGRDRAPRRGRGGGGARRARVRAADGAARGLIAALVGEAPTAAVAYCPPWPTSFSSSPCSSGRSRSWPRRACARTSASWTRSPLASCRCCSAPALLLLWRRPLRLPRAAWWRIAAMGLLGVPVYNLAFLHGLKTVPTGTAALIIALNPVFTTVLARIVLKEPFGLRRSLGLVLSLAGVFVVIRYGTDKPVDWPYLSSALVLVARPARLGLLHGDRPAPAGRGRRPRHHVRAPLRRQPAAPRPRDAFARPQPARAPRRPVVRPLPGRARARSSPTPGGSGRSSACRRERWPPSSS